jgi:hypothetical protein
VNQKALKKQLDQLPASSQVAFAARAAMRVLPVLVMPRKGLLDEAATQSIFLSWDINHRQQHISVVLHAYMCASCVGANGDVPITTRQTIRRAANMNADATASVAAFAAAFAACVACGAANVGNADEGIPIPEGGNTCAADAAAAAACADTAARRFNGIDTLLCFEQQLSVDITTLQTRSGAQLLGLPLWCDGAPDEWTQRWQAFQTLALQLNPSFAIWLAWYEERLNGQPINLPLLEKWLTQCPTQCPIQPPKIADEPFATINTTSHPPSDNA